MIVHHRCIGEGEMACTPRCRGTPHLRVEHEPDPTYRVQDTAEGGFSLVHVVQIDHAGSKQDHGQRRAGDQKRQPRRERDISDQNSASLSIALSVSALYGFPIFGVSAKAAGTAKCSP